MLRNLLKKITGKSKEKVFDPEKQKNADLVFKSRYSSFKRLLDSNSEFLNIVGEIEDKIRGESIFGMGFIRSRSTMAVYQIMRMVQSLNELTKNKHAKLFDVLEKINEHIHNLLEKSPEVLTTDYVIDYEQVTCKMIGVVGGKNANLGELKNNIDMPVPEGFAISTLAFYDVFKANDLFEEIKKIKIEMRPDDFESVSSCSEKIQKLIISARVPAVVEDAILNAHERLSIKVRKKRDLSGDICVALRSSAIGEDSDLSFAGQYVSFLNVWPSQIIKTYKFILAGLYIPRAITYRLNKGIRDEDSSMSVACLEMISAKAAGVAFSRHPIDFTLDHIFMNAVWGMGEYAVDGSINPDTYVVDKKDMSKVKELTAVPKEFMLTSRQDRDGLEKIKVPSEKRKKSCLGQEDILYLAKLVNKVEQHYNSPQDIEWAVDDQDKFYLLQARPINYAQKKENTLPKSFSENLSEYKPLIQDGAVASPGVGAGKVYHVSDKNDLKNFPKGAVLVAAKSSPQFVMAMNNASAIITEAGSITGHMASLAREFNVPAILGVKNVRKTLEQDDEVTVDANTGKIYKGRVEAILKHSPERSTSMVGTPVYDILKQISILITPLHLSDPKADNFNPDNCSTLHDIARFVHEVSYQAMFQLSDFVADHAQMSVKLQASLPIDLHIIDLGGGIEGNPDRRGRIDEDQVTSAPFKALLKGLLHEELRWHQPRPIEWGGLMSVMTEQLVNPGHNADRFGDKSYAIVSDKYLNFSSRVGYHFAVLDAYCGKTINKNYVTFSFKGGAADDVRRNRRVRAIARILEDLGFHVQVKADRVFSRFQKDEQEVIEDRLDTMGRLIIFTRQMDMLMINDECVELFAKSFLEGDYTLECVYDNIRKNSN